MRIRTTATCAVAVLAGAIGASAGLGPAAAKSTKAELQADLRDSVPVGDWSYDDIDAAFVRAVREKKPVCVVFR
jgi:hypothetical protein